MAVIRAFGTHYPKIANGVFVAETAAVLGDVELADDVSIWYGSVLRGDMGKIRIGARSNVQDNATVHMTHDMSDAIIGADVIIGHNAVVHGAIIEDGALIGMGSVIMDNAKVEAGAWVAAGSIVPPRAVIPKGMLARGTPAKPVRPVKPEEIAWAADAIERYVALGQTYLRDQKPSDG
jgi:carbonic anhydrase/acetyltransferase-like protein (isoleucine patch superfamily)